MGVSQGTPKLKFTKHSHVIFHRKAFFMLISDFEFIFPDFDFWAQGRESTTALIIFSFTTLLQTAMCAAEVETSVMSTLLCCVCGILYYVRYVIYVYVSGEILID